MSRGCVLTIGIGFDQVEATAWHTMVHSILSRASIPVQIIPIKQSLLRDIYSRPRDPKQSNEFSFTRFLLPHLCDYRGISVFFDCDMLVRCDIADLLDNFDPTKAVQVVKHDYEPCESTKYLGNTQYNYPKKNWSSVMLFNNSMCQSLTPEYVNTASGLELHQFKWLENDSLIGDLPLGWNWLVGEYPLGYKDVYRDDIRNVHFTNGGPYFIEYAAKDIDFAGEWFRERALMDFVKQRDDIVDFIET